MAYYRIEHYLTAGEHQDLFIEGLQRLKDPRARAAVVRQVARIEQGNFGEHKLCRKGVWELHVGAGSGYRIYYGLAGHRVVLLQCGGDMRTQRVVVDQSVCYWQDWRRRLDDEKPAS